MKRKTAKEILAESFRELAGKKSFDRITIREITDNCGYSPATFYRCFTDKFDLIAWDYVQRTARIMRQIGTDGYAWRQTLVDGVAFFQENRDYLKNLLLHTAGHDSFVRHMASTNIDLLTKEILRTSGEKALDPDVALCVRVYCFGTVQMVCEWIVDELDVAPEQLSGAFERALPASLREYLV